MPEITVAQAIAIATQHHEAGRLADAENLYRQILALEPNHDDALRLLGIVMMQHGKTDQAIDLIRRAIAIHPTSAQYHVNLGNALKAAGKIDAGIEAYREALRLKPEYPQAHYNLGVALAAGGRNRGAIEAYRQALGFKPDYSQALVGLGVALAETGRIDDAIGAYHEALHLNPDDPGVYTNLGNALRASDRLDEAMAAYERAIRINPDLPEAHWNFATLLLQRGDFERGFREFEWRWRWKDFPTPPRKFVEPLWDGTELDGRTILLYHEQGLGDTIQFIRYAPLVAARGGRVIVQCPPELSRLLHGVEGIAQVVTKEPLPPFDVQCPMMSLPLVMATRVETIPPGVPYLKLDANLARAWGERVASAEGGEGRQGVVEGWSGGGVDEKSCGADGGLEWCGGGEDEKSCGKVSLSTSPSVQPTTPPSLLPSTPPPLLPSTPPPSHPSTPRPKVGLAWAGSSTNTKDALRSISLSQLAPLAMVPGITFVSLQKGKAAGQCATVPPGMELMDLTTALHDFAETAALVSHLDLVITVDTAVAHLAGAIGKPVWVLIPSGPDWRWMLDREDSPWYPTMRLFRQKRAGDWTEVIERVRTELSRPLRVTLTPCLR